MSDVPPEIVEAANKVSSWFEMQGCDRWALMGVCSRNHATELENIRSCLAQMKNKYEVPANWRDSIT